MFKNHLKMNKEKCKMQKAKINLNLDLLTSSDELEQCSKRYLLL